jgi:hypothetical protein
LIPSFSNCQKTTRRSNIFDYGPKSFKRETRKAVKIASPKSIEANLVLTIRHRNKMLKTRNLRFAFTLLLAIAGGLAAVSLAQRSRSATPAKAEPSLLTGLPQSDAVALVQVKRLLNEALPKILAGSPAKLAEANAEIDTFKTKTGIDLRSFDQVAFGMHYNYPSAGVTKVDTVVLARGTFNAGAFVAAGRIAAAGKYREEKYQGRTIYIFTLNQELRVFGLMNMKVGELAVSAVDANTLALGNPDGVRKVINTGKERKALNLELIALATRDPNAVIGFGGNVTADLMQSLKLSNEEIVKDISAIRQAYGTVGITEKDVEMFLAARTVNADSAKNLSDTLEALKQFGAIFVGRMPAPKGSVARTALDNLKITAQGNELQIRTAVAQTDIAPLLRGD